MVDCHGPRDFDDWRTALVYAGVSRVGEGVTPVELARKPRQGSAAQLNLKGGNLNGNLSALQR
jgi:hypothetical protein